jgi:O-antigen/teichoic acid export membrane protein
MKISQIFKDTLWYGLIPKISTILNIIAFPLITPFLTSVDYGLHGIITSYIGISLTISVFGLNIHLTNSFYTHKKNFHLVWGRVLTLILFFSLILSILLSILLFYNLTEISNGERFFVIICAIIPILFQFNNIFTYHYYPLVYRPKDLVFRTLIANLISFATTFLSIYFFKLGYLGWLIGSALMSISEFFLFYKIFWRQLGISPILKIKLSRFKKWISVSKYLIPHTLGFVILSSSDRLIMEHLKVPLNDIGLYTLGYTLGGYVFIASTALITSISPRIQELYRSQNFNEIQKLFKFAQYTIALIIFLYSIWMNDMFNILINNPSLKSSSSIGVLVAFSQIVYPFYAFISTPAFIEEKTIKLLWLVILPGVLNVILNYIFIPLYGFKAAIYTTLFSYWFQLIIPYFVSFFRKKIINIYGNIMYPFFLFLIYVSLILLALLLCNSSIIYRLIISILFILIYMKLIKIKHYHG